MTATPAPAPDGQALEARLADAITGQLVCYTFPANYNAPIGRNETHEDVARRCGPLIAEALVPIVAAEVERAVGEHYLTTPVQCACGWREPDAPETEPTYAAHVAHVVREGGPR